MKKKLKNVFFNEDRNKAAPTGSRSLAPARSQCGRDTQLNEIVVKTSASIRHIHLIEALHMIYKNKSITNTIKGSNVEDVKEHTTCMCK